MYHTQWYCCGNFYTSSCYIKLWDWVFFMKTCLYHFCVRTYVRMCAKDEITSSKSMWLHIYIIIANSTYILSIKTCLHKCINVLKWTQPNWISTSVTYFTGQQPQATCTCTVASLSYIYTYVSSSYNRITSNYSHTVNTCLTPLYVYTVLCTVNENTHRSK